MAVKERAGGEGDGGMIKGKGLWYYVPTRTRHNKEREVGFDGSSRGREEGNEGMRRRKGARG